MRGVVKHPIRVLSFSLSLSLLHTYTPSYTAALNVEVGPLKFADVIIHVQANARACISDVFDLCSSHHLDVQSKGSQ